MPYCASAPARRARAGVATPMVSRGVRDFILLVIVQVAVVSLFLVQIVGHTVYRAVAGPYHLARRLAGRRQP